MKTFILATLLTLSAVSGVVRASHPAAANGNGSGSANPGGGYHGR
jgi:hypothetical protein